MSFKIKLKYYWNRLRFYLSFLLLAFYLTIGILFLFTDTWKDLLPKGRGLIGIVLVLFGVLRFYIAYRRYINKLLRIKTAVLQKETAKADET